MFSNMMLDITPVSFHGVLSMACFRGLRGLRYESSEFRTDFAWMSGNSLLRKKWAKLGIRHTLIPESPPNTPHACATSNLRHRTGTQLLSQWAVTTFVERLFTYFTTMKTLQSLNCKSLSNDRVRPRRAGVPCVRCRQMKVKLWTAKHSLSNVERSNATPRIHFLGLALGARRSGNAAVLTLRSKEL